MSGPQLVPERFQDSLLSQIDSESLICLESTIKRIHEVMIESGTHEDFDAAK